MGDSTGFSSDLLQEVRRLGALGEAGASGPSREAAEREIAGLDMYQVAANSGEERDPRYVGEVEGLLRRNDFEGLKARLGDERAAQVQDAYNQAWRRVEQDRGVPRSAREVAQDTAVGIGATVVNGANNAEAMVMGSPVGQFLLDFGGIGGGPGSFMDMSGQYAPALAEANQRMNREVVEPLYSDTLKNQRRLVGLQDAADEREHSLQADSRAESYRGDFLPTLGAWGRRVAADAGSGAWNTITNPTVAAQGTTDAVGSMILAGGVTKGLSLAGEKLVAARAAQILEQKLALGVEGSVAQEMAAKGVEALSKRVANASAMGGVAATEGASAYQQQAEQVLGTSTEELAQNSQDFRDEVAALRAQGASADEAAVIARRRVANRSAEAAAAGTGFVSAAIGHFLPEGAESPFHAVSPGSVASSFFKDAAKEGVEEFLQGGTGQLIGNAAQQSYVDPQQDVLSGVGTQSGAGGILGVASSGLLKAPSTAAESVGLATSRAREAVEKRAATKIAAVEAESPGSPQAIARRSDALSNDEPKIAKLTEAARALRGESPEADKQLQSELGELLNGPVVHEVPESVASLPAEMREKFVPEQSRAEAADAAARLFLAEKDPAQRARLGAVLSDLMEPVQRFRELPSQLARMGSDEESSRVIGEFQSVLSDIAAIPSVKRAVSELGPALEAGDQGPRVLAARAALDPSLGGTATAEQVGQALAHARQANLTPGQEAALKGSLALLRAREAAESSRDPAQSEKLLRQHLGGDRNQETSSRQATVEMNPAHMEAGKYSARQHFDRVVSSMVSGNTERARAYMDELGNFARHYQNKVEALSRSAASNGPESNGERFSYQQYVGGGKFVDSRENPRDFKHKDAWVNLKSERSVHQARAVSAEASLVADLHEGLRQAFPELGAERVERQQLSLEPSREESPAAPRGAAEERAADPGETPTPATGERQDGHPRDEAQPLKHDSIAEAVESHVDSAEPTRFGQQVEGMSLRDRARLVGTDYVTGLRTRQSWEESPRTGEKVMVVTSTAVKAINDHPDGGHDVTNDFLRVMGAAIGKIDPNAARGGTNFILETDRPASEVLDAVRRALPDPRIELTAGEGSTLEEAFQAESKSTEQARADGSLPPRGQTAFDLGKLRGIELPAEKAREKVSQQTVERVRGISDADFESQVLMDPVTPGVLSGTGWRLIPKKAFIASIDLKGLKKLNDLMGLTENGAPINGKVLGNKYLQVFSEEGLKVGGAALDFAHLSGDEYAVQSDSREELQAWLDKLEKHLQDNVEIEATHNGEPYLITPAFRQGIGGTYGEADNDLNTKKRAELAAAAPQAAQEGDGGGVRGPGDQGAGGDQPGADPRPGEAGAGPGARAGVATTAERFPRLFQVPGKVRNFFAASQVTRPDSTRTMSSDHPISEVVNAIQSNDSVRSFLGAAPRGTASPEVLSAYRDYLGQAAHLVAGAMNQNLADFLASHYAGEKTFGEALKDGTLEATGMQRGKALNLVELKPDGSLGYDPHLLESAVLAGLQWQLSSTQRQPVSRGDEIAQELGFDAEDDVPDAVAKLMSEGQSLAQAKQSLAGYVGRFWGTRPDPRAPMGHADGIPEAAGAELLRAMESAGLVRVTRLEKISTLDGRAARFAWTERVAGEDGRTTDVRRQEVLRAVDPAEKITVQEFTRYVTVDSESALNSYPELLEELVSRQPDFASYYGADEVPVADRQLSNSQVKLSDQARQALGNMQSQEFRLNVPLAEGLLALPEEELVSLFGNEISDPSRYNKTHLASLESQNTSLRGAFREMGRLVKEMRNRAGDSPVGDLAKKYRYAVNSVNRVMMLGAHNPQANKLMREVMLPTWSTLDLTDRAGEHHRSLMQAFAQAMQEKVHQRPLDENVRWSEEALAGPLSPVLDSLAPWLESGGPFPAAAYRRALGEARVGGRQVENTPLAAMALAEMARLRAASPAERAAFRTPVYLESDGMTNGPFNSMGLLAVGEVTESDVQNWRRGGLSVGSEPLTADQLRAASGKTDLYKAGMNAAQVYVNAQLRGMQEQRGGEGPVAVSRALFSAMESLLPDGEVSFDQGRGEWEFGRGLGKNPSTVLVYGAGNPGIANKIASRLTTAFYEKLSAAARVGGSWEDAALEMFPGDPPAQALYRAQQLRRAVDLATGAKVVRSKDTGKFHLVEKAESPASARVDRSFQDFKFSDEEAERLQTNLLFMLVNPMKAGIRDVLGPSVFSSGDLLVKATKLQSTVAREVYRRAIDERVEQKVAARADQLAEAGASPEDALKRARAEASSEFLSRQELDAVWSSLREAMPLVEDDGQRFMIAKSSLLPLGDRKFMYSRSLDDGMRTAPYAEGVDDAGVAARPYLTIGMGDARMVRKLYESPFPGTVQVFDGINLPADRVGEYGSRVNEAALAAWQGDVFGAALKTFKRFTEQPQVAEYLSGEGLSRPRLERAVSERVAELKRSSRAKMTPKQEADLRLEAAAQLVRGSSSLQNEAKQVLVDLEAHAEMQRARTAAIAKLPLSVDQMAGTYRPFVRPGTLEVPPGATDAQVRDLINAEIRRASERPALAAPAPSEGVLDPSGASVYTRATMPQFLSWLQKQVTGGEAEVLGEVIRSGALRDTRVVVGTQEQVAAYQRSRGLSDSLSALQERRPGARVEGYYHPGENTVYLTGPSTETAVHELVHAGTLGAVLDYYRGTLADPAAREAVRRLEGLMRAFVETPAEVGGEAGDALRDARAEIESHQPFSPTASQEGRARALNEFMAWTLSNRALGAELSRPDSALSRLARVGKSAYEAVKRLLTGGRRLTAPGEDFLSHVRFNTAVVARASGDAQSGVRDLALAHAVLRGGEPSRLSQVMEDFGRKVASHLTESYSADWLRQLGHNSEIGPEHRLAQETASRARTVFSLGEEAGDAFQMMVLAMATQADLNPQSMTEAQKLYDHFLRTSSQDDFLTGRGHPLQDESDARDKFEFLSGHTQPSGTDRQGRSTLLPTFLALATVSDEVRAVLAKKPVPGAPRGQVTGLDSAIEVAGQRVMDRLEEAMSGRDRPENLRVAMDQLAQGVTRTTRTALTSLADRLESARSTLYGWNSKVSDLLDAAGQAAIRRGGELSESSSRLARGVGSLLKVVSFMSSEESAQVLAEGALAQMDSRPEVGGFFKDVVADMIGRTQSQADVYDMVKRVRALVSQTRQAYRENVPRVISGKFSQEPTAAQWDSLYRVMGRSDLASLLRSRSVDRVLEIAAGGQALSSEVSRLEARLEDAHPQAARYFEKVAQHAEFVATGARAPNMLRNAYAVSELLGEPRPRDWVAPTAETVADLDDLMTLRSLERVPEAARDQFARMLPREREGLSFVLNYLKGQRRAEAAKASEGPARFNHYKGMLPSEVRGRGHVVVESNDRHAHMVQLGYEYRGPYRGSSLEGSGQSYSYWFSPEGGVRTTFTQGIAQNVQGTAYGVHQETGYSTGPSASRIADPAYVRVLAAKMAQERPGPEVLSPVYDQDGQVSAFERTLDPEQLRVLDGDQHLAKMIGEWKGRQVEEGWAGKVNEELVGHLHRIWQADSEDVPGSEARYVNLLDSDSLDPVVRDAVRVMPGSLKLLAQEKFGEGRFMVRKNMLNSTIGYRNASVGDLWTGTSRLSQERRDLLRKALIAMPGLGVGAYRKLVWAERNWQAAVASIKTNIVVRSIVVPAANTLSGIAQLQARGVPLHRVLKAIPAKVSEIEYYSKTMARKVELEAERHASEGDVVATRRIDAQLTALGDSLKRLSITPLLEAGEFSSIADVGGPAGEAGQRGDTLVDRLAAAVDDLPPGLRDLARQGYMARDTAVFQALQKAVQYSDFVMKSIYFDHLRSVEKKSQRAALAGVTEEFNNYDIPPGRSRGYAESVGLAWFLNYKIRATKIGMDMIRRNPLNLLIHTLTPQLPGVGIPGTDNLVSSLLELSLGRSFGPGMTAEPIALNPWYNLMAN